MTPDQILEVDVKRNQRPGMVAGNLRAIINANAKKNGGIVQQGKTLVIFSILAPKTMGFFCFSADAPKDLSKNMTPVFRMFKKLGVKTAETRHQSPQISDALLHVPGFQAKTSAVDGVQSIKVDL